MIHTNTPRLRQWLAEHAPEHAHKRELDINAVEFSKRRAELHPRDIPEDQRHDMEGFINDLAVFTCLTHDDYKPKKEATIAPTSAPADSHDLVAILRSLRKWLIAITILLLMFGLASVAKAQNNRPDDTYITIEADCPNCAGPLTVQQGLPPIGLTTYAASTSGTLGATPTDIAVLPGNASNTVAVSGVSVSCTQTTGGIAGIMLIKRSAADTGGVSVAMSLVPMDSNNVVGVTAPVFYTSNPTPGATIGVIDQLKFDIPATTSTTTNLPYVWPRPGQLGQPIILRGTAQQVAVNFGGQTIGGAACSVSFQWVETSAF